MSTSTAPPQYKPLTFRGATTTTAAAPGAVPCGRSQGTKSTFDFELKTQEPSSRFQGRVLPLDPVKAIFHLRVAEGKVVKFRCKVN